MHSSLIKFSEVKIVKRGALFTLARSVFYSRFSLLTVFVLGAIGSEKGSGEEKLFVFDDFLVIGRLC